MTGHLKRLGPMAKSVGRNLGWMLASRGVAAILSLVYLSIITRSLGVVDFGRFALITGASQALTILVAFQSWQIVIQYGVKLKAESNNNALAKLFLGSALIEVAGACVGVVLASIIIYMWSEALGIGPTLKRATIIFTVVQLVTIRSTAVGIIRLRDKFNLGAIAESMTPIGRFLGAIVVVIIHPTLQGFLVAWGFAEIITAAAYWYFASKSDDLALMLKSKKVGSLRDDHPGILKFALSTNANSTLGLASKQIPLLIVGAVSGPAAAGAFRLAAQISQALSKLSQIVSRAAFPEVVKSVKSLSSKSLNKFVMNLFALTMSASVVILLMVYTIGQPVLNIIGGKSFSSAWNIMIWLAIAGCFDLVTVGVETVLTALGRAYTVFYMRIGSVAVILTMSYILAPSMGGLGVSISVAIGSIFVSLLLTVAAARIRSPEVIEKG